MNFIYRIYEVTQSLTNSKSKRKARIDIILNQEVMTTDSRETFKENIRALYPDVKFANNGKLKDGDVYCIIISDNCYNTEEYIAVKDYQCAHCGKTFKSNEKLLNKFYGTYEFKTSRITSDVLREYEPKIKDMRFCSKYCMLNHKNEIINMLIDETLVRHNNDKDFPPDVFITRDIFNDKAGDVGYIYKISKKSSGQFYIGQTSYVPIYRWGQHLLTERFNLQNITDYVFEIVEVVTDRKLLNQRETY